MKIASIACAWPPYSGGIGNSASQISRLLSGRHEVTDFHPNNLKPWLRYGHGAFLPQLLWRLRRFDYIYLHYPFFGTAEIVWLFKLFCRRPKLIIHYHMDVKNLSWTARLLSLPSYLIRSSLLDQADIIVSASLDYVKNSQIKKYYRAHSEKFREIPFGVDLEKFRPNALKRPSDNQAMARAKEMISYVNDRFIKKNRFDLLFVGGLDRAHYFKGIDILLGALAEIKFDNWRLKIVGGGDLKSDYEKKARDLGLADKVEFTGRLEENDLIRSYQNADLLVLPSINKNEAFGIVLIEALACGAPVLASDLPGVRRVFNNYQEGWLTEPGDKQDLKQKLEFILADTDKWRTMPGAARRLAEKKYGLALMAESLDNLFS